MEGRGAESMNMPLTGDQQAQMLRNLLHFTQEVARARTQFPDGIEHLGDTAHHLQAQILKILPLQEDKDVLSSEKIASPAKGRVLIIKIGSQCFAIPQKNIVKIIKKTDTIQKAYRLGSIGHRFIKSDHQEVFPIVTLGKKTKIPDKVTCTKFNKNRFIIVCKDHKQLLGIVVDQVCYIEELVLAPLPSKMQPVDIYSGCAVVASGRIVPVLDITVLRQQFEKRQKRQGIISDKMENKDQSQAGGRVFLSEASDKIDKMNKVVMTSYVLFRLADKEYYRVTLQDISGIVDLDMAKVQLENGSYVAAYKDQILRLVQWRDRPFPQMGLCQFLLFTYDKYKIALMVDELIDVVHVKGQAGNNSIMNLQGRSYRPLDMKNVVKILPAGVVLKKSVSSMRPLHILLLEDSMFFNRFIPPELKAAGYDVDVACECQTAIQLMQQQRFDLIIADQHLMKALLKIYPVFPEIPVILMVSDRTGSDREALPVPIRAMISKTKKLDLRAAIKDALAEV